MFQNCKFPSQGGIFKLRIAAVRYSSSVNILWKTAVARTFDNFCLIGNITSYFIVDISILDQELKKLDW